MVEIKNKYTDEVICTGETLLTAVEKNLAYLRCADLRCADLSGADLSYADLRGAYLSGADLSGARVAWQSRDLLSELLRRSAGDDIAKLKVAGLLLVCRDKCWQQFVEIAARDPLGDWALDTLAEWVKDGDGAPEIVASRRSTQEAKNVKLEDA